MQKKADDVQSRRSLGATARESRFEHGGWVESLADDAESTSTDNGERGAHTIDRLANL